MHVADLMTFEDNYAPERLARAKAQYRSGEASVAALAESLGLTPGAMRWRIRKWRWTRAAPPKKAQAKQMAAPTSPTRARPEPARGADTKSLIVAVRHALEGEIAALQERIAQGAASDAQGAASDANARTLASLARTLSVLRAIETEKDGENAYDDDKAPLDLAELRRELARRIDLLREQRNAADPS